jgi:hypothetical protein
VVFLPPEGRVSGPLHEAFTALLGRAAFVLPLAFAFVGMLMVVRALRPTVELPRRRLVGIGLLLIAVLVGEQLLAGSGEGAGLVGHWLGALFLDLLGAPVTGLLLLTALAVGVHLGFDFTFRLPGPRHKPDVDG